MTEAASVVMGNTPIHPRATARSHPARDSARSQELLSGVDPVKDQSYFLSLTKVHLVLTKTPTYHLHAVYSQSSYNDIDRSSHLLILIRKFLTFVDVCTYV